MSSPSPVRSYPSFPEKRKQAKESVTQSDDTKLSEDSVVIRCVCGANQHAGVCMVQCEQCFVWQHAECVGINEQDVPEIYHCENCDPTNPVHVRPVKPPKRFVKQTTRKRSQRDHTQNDDVRDENRLFKELSAYCTFLDPRLTSDARGVILTNALTLMKRMKSELDDLQSSPQSTRSAVSSVRSLCFTSPLSSITNPSLQLALEEGSLFPIRTAMASTPMSLPTNQETKDMFKYVMPATRTEEATIPNRPLEPSPTIPLTSVRSLQKAMVSALPPPPHIANRSKIGDTLKQMKHKPLPQSSPLPSGDLSLSLAGAHGAHLHLDDEVNTILEFWDTHPLINYGPPVSVVPRP